MLVKEHYTRSTEEEEVLRMVNYVTALRNPPLFTVMDYFNLLIRVFSLQLVTKTTGSKNLFSLKWI